MPEFITLTCPSCGGKLKIAQDIDRFACAHCGMEHLVKREMGIVALAPVLSAVTKGVDNTASELAILRLDKEIAEIESKIRSVKNSLNNSGSDEGEIRVGCGILSGLTIILGIVIISLTSIDQLGLGVIIFGILGFAYLALRNSNRKSEQHARIMNKIHELENLQSKLKRERKQHRDKLNMV